MDWLAHEKEYLSQGKKFICGVDEAGRGPLAGPVYAAAVILPPDGFIIDEDVNDSKKISEKKRNRLYDVICSKAYKFSIASASVEEVDSINILNATYLAMKRAVEGLMIDPDIVLVDGNMLPKWKYNSKAIVKGDATCYSIACASILAKVSRDRFMISESEKYPEYVFEKHKGYGTKLHIDMIKKYGTCPLHRKTFLRNILK